MLKQGPFKRQWLLVNEKTGEPLNVGDKLTTFRGEECILTDATPPKHAASTGRVYVKDNPNQPYPGEYFPSVVGAKWVQQPASTEA